MCVIKYEQCKNRLTHIYLNPAEIKYYPFMMSLDKCSESYNYANDLSLKIVFPVKQKM